MIACLVCAAGSVVCYTDFTLSIQNSHLAFAVLLMALQNGYP
jgi:hypothetical protein